MAPSTQNNKNPWAQAYETAWNKQSPQDLQKRPIYKDAISAGIDPKIATQLARLEAFTLASSSGLAAEAQNSLVAVGLQLQHDLNLRTSYLGREIGKLWQARQGGIGTAIWNAAAATTIGRNLGLQPVATAAVPPNFNPYPKPVNPQANPGTPPTFALSSTLTTATFTIAADPTVSLTDRGGVLILTNGAGAGYNFGTSGAEILTVTFHTPYTQVPSITAYAQTDASSTTVGLYGPLQVKNGGSKTAFTLQALSVASGNLPSHGTLSIRFSVHPVLGSSTPGV